MGLELDDEDEHSFFGRFGIFGRNDDAMVKLLGAQVMNYISVIDCVIDRLSLP